MPISNDYKVFTTFTIKVAAIIFMFIDHLGVALFPQYQILRVIGRIAFPLFCFTLVEGFFFTKDLKKYVIRLMVFGFISEIPFDMVVSKQFFNFNSQNVYFTLALGILLIYIDWHLSNKDTSSVIKFMSYRTIPRILIVAAFAIAALLLKTDYGAGGVLLIYGFYVYRKNSIAKAFIILVITSVFYVPIEYFAIISVLFMMGYNGQKGPKIKYVFYCFYPIHLLILGIIAFISRGLIAPIAL